MSPHMRSIWSKSYDIYKNSSNTITEKKNFFNITSTSSSSIQNQMKKISPHRPLTLGMSKTINSPFKVPSSNKNSNSFNDKQKSLKENTLPNKISTKRKFEAINNHSISSNSNENEVTVICDETELIGQSVTKKNEANQEFIDHMLNEYKNGSLLTNSTDETLLKQHLSPIKDFLINRQNESISNNSSSINSPILTKKNNLQTFKKDNSSKKYKTKN
jgi:hypothetical protein